MEKPRKGTSGGRIPTYDQSFKIAVASEYINGEFSQTQVARKHNISEETVHFFVQWYRKHISEQLPSQLEPQAVSEPGMQADLTSLQQENAYLKLKVTALEMLISNAEKEMGADIRKKPGSKPSWK
jgi:transposase